MKEVATSPTGWPRISVVVPCYNHARYLPEAIASLHQQAYPNLEILVVDDGSTDDTAPVAQALPGVQYHYQANQGLSAARNTGIRHSTGQYLVFLDADDWLLPGALLTNLSYLQADPALAFVSGGHDKVFEARGLTRPEVQHVTADHYCQLLQGNYIGMHATVMYQRWVFDTWTFDPALPACEDYDLYLRVARCRPVAHHDQRLAAYRLHDTNMSGNVAWMLQHVLAVLQRQRKGLRTAAERQAFARGRAAWKEYYRHELEQQRRQNPAAAPLPWSAAAAFGSSFFIRHHLHTPVTVFKKVLKRLAPTAGLRLLHQAGFYSAYLPPVGKIAAGDFARPLPFSSEFGYDRGGPVDRYYIENFLREQSALIRGRVLEIGGNDYTLEFGQGVTQSDILHVDDSNPQATFVGDLSCAPHLPDNAFDCLILTQTLHLIYHYQQALATCYRILKPGGTLLLTVPGITPIDRGEWKKTWYWSFTDSALHRLLAECFPAEATQVQSFGNVYVATAFLYGMGAPELSRAQLDFYDPQFQVINAVKAVKPLA